MRTDKRYTVQTSSTQEMTYRILRDEILSMELKPGTIITTQETAERIGVSRTPVREAFIRLQKECLLDISPQRATMVSYIDLQRVYQERFIREALEIENLKMFIPLVTEKTVLQMKENIEQQEEAMTGQRYEEYIDMDNLFHQIAFEETGEVLGLDIVRRMNGHYDRIRLLTAWEGNIARNAIKEHKEFVEYIEEKDLENAQKLMRKHLQNLRLFEKVLLEKWPDYFKMN